MTIVVVLFGWLLFGFLAAGWEYADLHHSWLHGDLAPRVDLSLVMVMWLTGPVGVLMEVWWRLGTREGYGWKLPYSDLPPDEWSSKPPSKLSWFRVPEKEDDK